MIEIFERQLNPQNDGHLKTGGRLLLHEFLISFEWIHHVSEEINDKKITPNLLHNDTL